LHQTGYLNPIIFRARFEGQGRSNHPQNTVLIPLFSGLVLKLLDLIYTGDQES